MLPLLPCRKNVKAMFPILASELCSGHKELQFSFEGAVEDGGEQGIQLGGVLGLQALQRVHLRRQRVQLGLVMFYMCRFHSGKSGCQFVTFW